jgi:hypothetical protein
MHRRVRSRCSILLTPEKLSEDEQARNHSAALLRDFHLLLRLLADRHDIRGQVICPSGGLLKGVSTPFCKNISLHPSGKSSLQIRPIPLHKRGVSWPSRNAGWVAVDAAALSARWIAGGFLKNL